MKVFIPQVVTVVELEGAPFGCYTQAKSWARSHGVIGVMSDVDTAGKGEVVISSNSLDKMLSGSAMRKSVTPAIHYSAMMRLRDIIRESFVAEIHPDYKKVNGRRSSENGVNPNVDIAVLYGCVSFGGIPYRAKTTLKLHRDVNQPTKAYSYEISNIEVLTGIVESEIQPNVLTSMDVDILLNNVRRVNGERFCRTFAYGMVESRKELTTWLKDKTDIVLVTGRKSFEACGAADFLRPYLAGKNVLHLTTVGENARTEDVVEKTAQLPVKIDGYIAVGGGTVIDTTKLLRNGFPDAMRDGAPFMAIPTTAGTGAEATRFAVYYDYGKKMSADDVRYLPTDVLLIPEFSATQSAYQKASANFDAYAQAVESLWAKGATEESRVYANRALRYVQQGEWCLASYWSGRAIDLSRTTAAHAFSYYMTATYGVPHGAAVYMMFPYICRANGHLEFIRRSAKLKTLREFAAEKNLDWNALIDELFANVNPARLGNNPCEVRKGLFKTARWQ